MSTPSRPDSGCFYKAIKKNDDDDEKSLPTFQVDGRFADLVIDELDRRNISFDYHEESKDDILVKMDEALLREIFASSYYLEHWYDKESKSCIDNTFKSILIPWPIDKNEDELKKEIDKALKEFPGCQAFVKLNSVSPKYKKPCTTSEEVLNLLLTTDRTREELKSMRDHKFDVFIVLREFHDLSSFLEFRLFIARGQLRAVSQNFEAVDDECYKHRHDILAKIQMWLKKNFNTSLPFEDCIMDIAYSKDKIWLVEFNSFGKQGQASAGLYDWDHDYFELYCNSTPTIRVLTNE